MEAVLEEEESRSYARTSAIERATRPGHGKMALVASKSRSYQTPFLCHRKDRREHALASEREVNNLDV